MQPPSKPSSNPVPSGAPSSGECFRGTGGRNRRAGVRRAPRAAGRGGGEAGPGAPGPPRAAPYLGAPQAGEAARSRRGPRSGPLAAGRSWAGAAAAAAGSPGLWAEAAADAATAPQAPLRSGTRRPQARPLRGPGPGSAPDQHLEPDRNCPTCSCSPTGAAAAAPNRTRGRRHGPPCHRRASLRPHGGGPAGPARSSALRAPADAPRPSARLPDSLRLGWRTLSLKPPLPPPSRDAVGPRRVTAAPRGPEAPGAAALPPAGDGRSRSPMAGRRGWRGWRAASAPPGPLGRAGAPGQQAAAQRTAAFGVSALGIGLRAKLGGRLPGASDLLASSLEEKCATDGWRQENNPGGGGEGAAPGFADAHLGGRAGVLRDSAPAEPRGLAAKGARAAALPPAPLAAGVGSANKPNPACLPLPTEYRHARSHLSSFHRFPSRVPPPETF